MSAKRISAASKVKKPVAKKSPVASAKPAAAKAGTTKKVASKSTTRTSAVGKPAANKNATKSVAKPRGSRMIEPKKGASKDLRELFIASIKDLYWAENALAKALPKMSANATNPDLKLAITSHTAQTKEHVARLKEVFASIKVKPAAKKCDAMEGLLKEGQSIMEETVPGSVRDAGIIAASQKVEHYEIASYGTVAAFAKVLKYKEALKLLLATLDDETKADKLMTVIADTHLNHDAI
ncbi:MAG TPA: ferritin-like domain-containing protein [Saprospiraceae bacterium]|nr:ferritin-like domain-containing protein [Saprospiraceae bacterium]HQW54820.1 ferritin-like domain-containing protein [Saprospiraceae bacterium]